MLQAILLTLLVAALLAPPLILSRKEERLRWWTRYFLSALPAAYTGFGWQVAVLSYDLVGCQGGMKNIHTCWIGSADITPLIDHGFFLMIPCVFVAVPLSLWLLLNTAAKQIGAWHRRNRPEDEGKPE